MNNNPIDPVQQYREFAEERLNNHLMELHTKYGGEPVESKELMEKGYEDHREILSRELEHQQMKFAGNANPWLDNELEQLKQHYLNRLSTGNKR